MIYFAINLPTEHLILVRNGLRDDIKTFPTILRLNAIYSCQEVDRERYFVFNGQVFIHLLIIMLYHHINAPFSYKCHFYILSCTKSYERKLLIEMNEIEINCMRNIGMPKIYFGTQIDVARQFALNYQGLSANPFKLRFD